MDIQENVPLSTLTTFRTGGPVRFLITIERAEELPDAVVFAKEKGVPLMPLGSGSNMLAPDEGLAAACVRLRARTVSISEKSGTRLYTADAGLPWDDLVLRAVDDGAWGIENLSAIPGTVGAAAVQNIGAYGAALSDSLESVDAFDMRENTSRTFLKNECRFGYRTSVFKEEPDRYFITAITLALSALPKPNVSYRDLARRFEGKMPTLGDIRSAVIEIRAGKFPPLSQFGTAGSFFLNPVLSSADAEAVKKRFPEMPLFEMPEGGVKVPLAWIFDRVLSLKGLRIGGAFVWEKQPLVIAADKGASARDVRALAEKITEEAREKTGIAIVPEARILP